MLQEPLEWNLLLPLKTTILLCRSPEASTITDYQKKNMLFMESEVPDCVLTKSEICDCISHEKEQSKEEALCQFLTQC